MKKLIYSLIVLVIFLILGQLNLDVIIRVPIQTPTISGTKVQPYPSKAITATNTRVPYPTGRIYTTPMPKVTVTLGN